MVAATWELAGGGGGLGQASVEIDQDTDLAEVRCQAEGTVGPQDERESKNMTKKLGDEQ